MMKDFHGLKLLTHCGGGAYGDVYYCEDISGKKMAVKIVSKKKLGDSWERELRGVINYRKITENAPGLLQIFHVEEDEDSFFYTMEPADSASDAEYVPDTLAHRLQSGPLPQTDLLRILSGVFNGIKLIHEAGFTHRDIKPDNILFVKGVPKLADIGLLSSLSATMTQLAGTLDFIPPEERTADSLESSDRLSRQRNDLYAFGKVIYCAATGMSPHEYPATPVDMPLSPPLKYFLQLSRDLCGRKPTRRLNSIQRLEQEFKDIERKLLYGETIKDKFIFRCKQNRLKLILTGIIFLFLTGVCIFFMDRSKCKICGVEKFVDVVCESCVNEFVNLATDQKLEQLGVEKNADLKNKLVPFLIEDIGNDWKIRLNHFGYGKKEYFDDLLVQCQKICNIKCSAIDKSKISLFAEKYINYYNSNITVEVTGFRGKVVHNLTGIITLKEYFLGVNDKTTDEKKINVTVKCNEDFEIKLRKSITMKPWERPFVWVSWQRYIPFKLETDRVYFNPQVKDHQGEDEFDCGQYLHGFEHFFVKFKIAAGKTFPGLCVDVFGIEKPDFNSIVKS